MRSKFDEQLKLLSRELIRMGARCEEALDLVSRALASGDLGLASQVHAVDGEIDRMERDIENLCLRLLLQQQPVAGDLRKISAALKMITDLERVGDQASDIAEIIPFLGTPTQSEREIICRMASEAANMVTGSVDAYVKRDITLAGEVIDRDDVVDGLFTQVKATLIAEIAKNPQDGESALDLLMIAKYLERIGDHATNIAEWVVFSVTGVHDEHEGESK